MRLIEVTQQTVFYKGYNPGDTRRISTGDPYWDSKMFVSSDRRGAEFYGSHIREFDAAPDAKILYERSRPFLSIAKGIWNPRKPISMLEWASEVVRRAEAAGYDAVWFIRQSDLGTVIINPEKFIERPA